MTSRTLVFPLYTTKININKKTLATCLIGILFSLMVISIIQINAYTKETYTARGYGREVAQLQEETSFLEINLSKANSLNNLTQHIEGQTFVKADKIEYIKLFEGTAMAK
jgi:hypothetical protein